MEITLKILAAIGAILAAYKVLITVINLRKDSYVKRYELAEKLISDGKIKDSHDYSLELGYLALTGKKLEASLIRYFLSLKDPQEKILLYHSGMKNLKIVKDEEENVENVILIDSLNTKEKVKKKKMFISIPYIIYAMLGLLPLVIGIEPMIRDTNNILLILIWSIPFLCLAGMEIYKASTLTSAIKLNEMLEKVNKN